MTKTRRLILENLKLVDVVIELVDARVPFSSKNPDIDTLAGGKPRIVIMNKIDLANPTDTEKWVKWFEGKKFGVILVNSVTGKGIKQVDKLAREMMKEKIERDLKRGRIFRPIRAMIVGIPNVGKSTFINKLVGKASAKTGDRPGVTRGKQWIKVKKDFELLDTPGILWPKFEDVAVGIKLACTGAIKDDILDLETLALNLIEILKERAPGALEQRYDGKNFDEMDAQSILKEIAIRRAFLSAGGETNDLRTAQVLLDEFRGGKLGSITLEIPEL
jgi:ribosome biogenesis GTPase A